ncbi:MAG: FtsW/RodA/SpoVE family cell cycle protein, partial [bacterium]|nr:FtsW/RodA/SpoVE family cell cycle protein [bacterium]
SIGHPKNLLISFIYAVIPAGLIAIQPDFGSAIIIIGIWFGYILVSGIQWKHLLLIMSIAIFGFGALWMSPFFAEYQKERVLNLLNPDRDPLGYGYNVIQSKIAIGSAGIWGKGFGQGTQAQLGFLPEAHSDFIFAAFIEEWGLVGGILVICAFLLILFQIMRIGLRADDNFTKLFCLGTSIVLLLHFILNVGSTIGLVPVVGVSFPFLSHGGSNFLLNAVLIGFIQSMRTHRYV